MLEVSKLALPGAIPKNESLKQAKPRPPAKQLLNGTFSPVIKYYNTFFLMCNVFLVLEGGGGW